MTRTSLAAVFTGPGRPVELRRLALPRLVEGEALVRVTCSTICGSDLHTVRGDRPSPVPSVLGHEVVGRVEELGPGRPARDLRGAELAPGQRVTWSVAVSCGDCFTCRRGLPQKCETLRKYGHEELAGRWLLNGGLSEYCHLAAGTAIARVPESIPDEVVAPASCATATVAAALRCAGNLRGASVLVLGAGALGLTACAMARSRGAAEVIASDVDPRRRKLAARFGATRCAPGADDTGELGECVKEATAGRGVDVALELSGSGSSVESALELTRIGGRSILVGSVFPGPPVAVSPEWIVRRLLRVEGVHNYTPEDLETAVSFLSEHHGNFPLAELVEESFPLRDAEKAFRFALERRPPRVAIKPGTVT